MCIFRKKESRALAAYRRYVEQLRRDRERGQPSLSPPMPMYSSDITEDERTDFSLLREGMQALYREAKNARR